MTETLEVGVGSSVKTDPAKIELIMALDLSSSMEGARMTALKTSAQSLVDRMLTGQTGDRVRIGLAPYGESLNAGIYGGWAKGHSTYTDYASAGSTKSCVTERRTSLEFSDELPMPGEWMGNLEPWCPETAIAPLTSDAPDLTAVVSSLSVPVFTSGQGSKTATASAVSTPGHLGVVWSWYMLSPKWNSVWPHGSDAGAYTDPNVKKVMVLMTDGVFITDYDSTATQFNWMRAEYGFVLWSGPNAVQLCQEMHQDGIIIYTIGLDVPAADFVSNARQNLLDCASSEDHFYEIDSADELMGVFNEIAGLLTGPIITG